MVPFSLYHYNPQSPILILKGPIVHKPELHPKTRGGPGGSRSDLFTVIVHRPGMLRFFRVEAAVTHDAQSSSIRKVP